jgi:class 3 adenylate cyclase
MDVAAWLRGLGLSQYEQAFREHAICAEVLPSLTAEDLKELGVRAVGDRRLLLESIAALRREISADSTREMPTPATREGERRQVAVMFADLAGFTALSNELDAEQVQDLLDRYFERVDSIVDAHGGTVDKHIGDCVMRSRCATRRTWPSDSIRAMASTLPL